MYQKIKKSYFPFVFLPLFLVSMLGLVSACGDIAKDSSAKKNKTEQKTPSGTSKGGNQTDDRTPPNASTDSRIPAKVYQVLAYVRENKAPMNNYVGGRNFGNFERLLPQKGSDGRKLKFQEWDVNPKKNGENRGVERLITASNGQAWYTNDHYASFTEIKN